MSVVPTRTVAHYLEQRHYLGKTGRGFAWSDEYGVLVLAKPTSRRLPQDGTWLELVRWCLVGTKNGGSRQWAQWKDGATQSVKDRWVFVLRADARRDEILRVKDDALTRAAA